MCRSGLAVFDDLICGLEMTMRYRMWSQPVVLVILSLLVAAGQFCPGEAFADDQRLLKRIAELEAENRALRKILGDVQGAIRSIESSLISESPDSEILRIIVMSGDWGDSSLADIRKVCASAAGTILTHMPGDGFAPILVQRGKGSPITLFRRGAAREYIVRLNSGDRAWAQFAFQFAHEFGHIICNYRDVRNPQLWFEESLCECASLYALQSMAVTWKTNPPYSNWKAYAEQLEKYAGSRVEGFRGQQETPAEFYQRHRKKLEQNATDRKLNGFVALKLLPLFEQTPAAWQTLRYLNLGPETENRTFREYLSGWHGRVPPEHQSFVKRIAVEFGIEIAE